MLVTKNKLVIFFLLIFTSIVSAENLQNQKLDKLFDELSKVKNISKADYLEKQIWAVWNKHPKNEHLSDKLELGTMLMYEGDYRYAFLVFTNVIKSDPSWSEAWNKRATLLFFMKDYKRSLEDIDKVLNLEPRHFGALTGRAQIFIELEKYSRALEDLKKARKIHPVIRGNNLIYELEKLTKGLNI
tara:strand:+ start:1235 stop:1792 length:558 start_codon:yes stop_codon:yes gene_type:complete